MIKLPDTFIKMLRSIFSGFLLMLAATTLKAQADDTLRRKDPDGREFIQIIRNKNVFTEGYLQHGKKQGVWTEFWESKLPHYVTTYDNGVRNGLFLDIRRTGQVENLNYYRNDLLDGPARRFMPGGVIVEESYYSDGIRSGAFTKWYANGRVQEQSNYNNNLRDGKTVYFLENGSKVAEYYYNRGKLDGDAIVYGENGRISEFGSYLNDEQVGIWKEYYADGTLKAEGKYLNGEKTGTWKQYDEKGNPKPSIQYQTKKSKK